MKRLYEGPRMAKLGNIREITQSTPLYCLSVPLELLPPELRNLCVPPTLPKLL